MANLLKKLQCSNPLEMMGMEEELKAYENAQNDEELANVYHALLNNCKETNTTLESFIYAMITYSTGQSINATILL